MWHDTNRRWPRKRAQDQKRFSMMSTPLNEPYSGASSEQSPVLAHLQLFMVMRTLALLSIAAAVSVAHGQKPKPAPVTAAAQSPICFPTNKSNRCSIG